MSKRDEEKRKSLSDLARIADKAAAMPWLDKRVQPPKPAAPRPAPAKPRAAPPPAPAPSPSAEAEKLRRKRLEERRLKLEEERQLKERRQKQLQGAKGLEWRGMAWGDVPTGIRRTPFDRAEPSLQQKLSDVLGDAKQKEGREKARAKGKRQAGGR